MSKAGKILQETKRFEALLSENFGAQGPTWRKKRARRRASFPRESSKSCFSSLGFNRKRRPENRLARPTRNRPVTGSRRFDRTSITARRAVEAIGFGGRSAWSLSRSRLTTCIAFGSVDFKLFSDFG